MIYRINEQQYRDFITSFDLKLNEDVYVSGLQNKRNKNIAQLTYKKGKGKNAGNKKVDDKVKTDKMDASGNDTYEVMLKGGIKSFNITSIDGTEVMHYFKNYFRKKQTVVKVNGENYELDMEDREFEDFMNNFLSKVGNVVNYEVANFKRTNPKVEFSNIYIYPVPSSSNFNVAMSEKIVSSNRMICNLPTLQIDKKILEKNTENLQKDEDFINKNKEYYNSNRWTKSPKSIINASHLDYLEDDLNKLISRKGVNDAIEEANKNADILIRTYYSINSYLKSNKKLSDRRLETLKKAFCDYQESVNKIKEAGKWFSNVDNKEHVQMLNKIAQKIKYSKGPSIEKRSGGISKLLKQYGFAFPQNYNNEICFWEKVNFQIKNLGNDVRMGLKNYYQPNEDYEMVKQEVEKIKSNIVVIFDDNISGGATLSDICLQLKNLGIEYLIPITFGKMRTSYNMGATIRINAPTEFNY